ncbi:hypothetical protein BROUX41_005285 [Berkeleyomyces rouxiae]|uniref:uncharacterized protein n=1 Tax=Berkeleyomyces rouxiae TaxID=2035830 RepID=UPI003B77783A
MAYVLAESYLASSFWDGFSIVQPAAVAAGSWAQYASAAEAADMNLVRTTDAGSVILQMDAVSGSVANETADARSDSAGGPKRGTVRVQSKRAYSNGLVVVDLEHMPAPICGGLPRFFAAGADADLIVIESTSVESSSELHSTTSGSCRLPATDSLANKSATDCFTQCGFSTSPYYVGSSWNAANGGIYALLWTEGSAPAVNDDAAAARVASTSVFVEPDSSTGLFRVWAWARGDVPAGVLDGRPEPAQWGTPLAVFGGDACQGTKYYHDLRLVFDMDLCSDSIEEDWDKGCAQATSKKSCAAFASGNAEAFSENYWEINSVNVYVPEEIKPLTTLGGATPTVTQAPGTSLTEDKTIFKATGTSTFSWDPNNTPA